ncbi:MAG: efflux RND transporter periplasmic adaptor subunit [Lachnospiraceae bacterium]|nr:efflux RND transporter periplasmic adaptor subunit [Lachnospiraceae bacterium]
MSKLGKIMAGVIGVGAVAALGAVVYMRINKPEEPVEEIPLPAVQIDVPASGSIELRTELTGTVEPADVVYVIPKGAGEVLEVYANQGDRVEKNQKLFRIDNKQLDAARITLDQARLALNDAQTSLNRMQVLYESGDISAQSYEATVNGVSQASLQVKSAKLNYDIQLENSTVTAPIAGLLEQFDVEVHDMVSSAGAAAMISGEGSKSVSFSVTERVVNGLAVGDGLVIEKNGMEYTGAITEIGTMVDAATGLFKVKASLAEADGLATGTMVKLYVIAQRAENVMTVPVDCVSYANGDAFVYTYDEPTQTANKILIEQGLIDAEKVEVRSGLSWDDQVVVTWSKEIYDGAAVRLADGGSGIKETEAAGTVEETAETEKDAQ